jgi:hypothetical protein
MKTTYNLRPHVHRSRLGRAVTISTWVVAVLLSIVFYFLVLKNPSGIEWLGYVLLGMIAFGLFLVTYDPN